MTGYPNIYTAVVYDLHPKVRNFIDQLNTEGQIDLCAAGYPYLIRCERSGPNIVTTISRNNRPETFVLNPRKRSEPITSWSPADGFQRPVQNKTVLVQPTAGAEQSSRRERARRVVPMEAIEQIVDSMWEN